MEDFWSLNESVFYCLYDPVRSRAFKRAIRNTVRKGDVVVDLGAGSGILSLFAADAGATRVYAVEADLASASSLKETVKVNGYADRVIVMAEDATSVTLPEKVDVIICEMIATGLLEELQVPAMNHALRFARPGCRTLLKEYDILADLVDNRNVYHGKHYQCVRFELPDKPSTHSRAITGKLSIRKVEFTQRVRKMEVSAHLRCLAERDGVINGLRLSGCTTFHDGSVFTDSLSYSMPMVLPLAPVPVTAGEPLEFSIRYKLNGGPQSLRYRLHRS